MATLLTLPATTYVPPSPALARNRRRSLNTIIEDEERSVEKRGSSQQQRDRDTTQKRKKDRKADRESPISEHFPTPRGTNFMSAPIPVSPTSSSTDSHLSSAPWSRDSFTTEETEFDDIYGVSDDEIDRRKSNGSGLVRRSSGRRQSVSSVRLSSSSARSRTSLPSLIIPTSDNRWLGSAPFKVLNTPIPPTPPPKVPMSPAIYSYLANKEVPSLTAPPSLDGSSANPSLDGSLTSEQLDKLSAPPTPDTGNDEDPGGAWGNGVQLQPAAMATLRALSGDNDYVDQQIEQVLELSQMSPELEMQQSPPPLVTNIRRNDSIILTPAQQRAMQSLTKLEIPSPGGFFSSLTPGSRHTWHMATSSPKSARPPSSSTAEHFYKTPWTSRPVGSVFEVSETASDGICTARPNLKQLNSDLTVKRQDSDETVAQLPHEISSPRDEDVVPTEMLEDYSFGYVRTLIDNASVNIDRTGMWLSAQAEYLSALINPPEERDDEDALLKRQSTVQVQRQASSKKTVRFSEMPIACPKPPQLRHLESAYYRSFQTMVTRSRYRDTFVHRIPRFEALQAQRISFPEAHRSQLLGKFQLSVVPLSAKKRMSANVARGDEEPIEDPERLKREREREAMRQMSGPIWNVMAGKIINGGRLIAAPVAKRLARLSSMGPTTAGVPRDRAKILDLGGQATCDWAWHCATEYPNTKVYTVTTKSIRQLSNSNIRGPTNHHQVAVEKLWLLPFKDNNFDLISARYFYTILKAASENGIDEYDACLNECFRVLKPGGYIEFSLIDSDIVNPGPLCEAMSVEFGFILRARGYDAQPTKSFLNRLHKAGFRNLKRAWMFLPMGPPNERTDFERDSWGVERKLESEAMVVGSTDNVAAVTGVVGSWAWEKWMLGLQLECGREDDGLLGGVHAVLEEGRRCGAGWRSLSGWARKPLT